ncbi:MULTISPECIES: EthD family reductase [Rhodococcus]|uniref:EthD family reductase n=1 Tax=Rhodococcus TaxID=1827 RepID=UPI00193B8433|nr:MULTISPECIES: EthD family reductase [Rhodococcus]QRI77196.1 EthD family reductase [Rhodococcus aetherivorans]QSE60615.1 EthD family reductase [Rhodococcus sp. PSBB066]QSE68077.1 EthD family reductase [Rhodococcus sp. PSBB049]
MYRLVAAYTHPEDPEKFLEHYRNVHSKLALKQQGIRNYEWGVCSTPDGSTPPHFLVAVCDWDSKEAMLADMASPEGQQGAADLENFAQAGVSFDFYEITKDI